MSNDLKWMIGSDFQFPYQDKRMVELWFKVMKWFKPDAVDYAGDISDQDCWSRWTDGTSEDFVNAIKLRGDGKEPVLPFVFENEKPTKEFYQQTRKIVPKADMFSALGNHDIRVWPYFDKKMPELVEHLTPEALWGFDTLGISHIHYSDRPKHRFGDIYVHHGNSISKHAGESVRNDIDSFGVSLIRGHSHRMGTYFKTFQLREETLRGYEIGHNMDVNCEGANYDNIHNWQKGFAIGHIESGNSKTKDGLYPHIQLIHVNEDYSCFVDGKHFSA